jgi:hypothetical protein
MLAEKLAGHDGGIAIVEGSRKLVGMGSGSQGDEGYRAGGTLTTTASGFRMRGRHPSRGTTP